MKRAREFQLLNHLPHLLRRAHFDFEALFTRAYGADVTSRQLALLVAVARRPGASQSQVAQDIGLDLNTCSDIVVRSVAKGMLRRERSPDDARTFRLQLTQSGQKILDDGTAKAKAYQDAAAARLTAQERKQLVVLLRKMLGFDA